MNSSTLCRQHTRLYRWWVGLVRELAECISCISVSVGILSHFLYQTLQSGQNSTTPLHIWTKRLWRHWTVLNSGVFNYNKTRKTGTGSRLQKNKVPDKYYQIGLYSKTRRIFSFICCKQKCNWCRLIRATLLTVLRLLVSRCSLSCPVSAVAERLQIIVHLSDIA